MRNKRALWVVVFLIVAYLFLRERDAGPNVGVLPCFQPVTERLTAESGWLTLPEGIGD